MTTFQASDIERHLFLTSGGTETYLQFLQGYALRDFCAFELLDDDAAFEQMEARYLHPIADAALERGHGLIADALLWRASMDYLTRLGYGAADLERLNRRGVSRLRESLRRRRARRGPEAALPPLWVAADIGPRGDGYQVPSTAVSVSAALDYHLRQIEAVAGAEPDLVCALTMTNVSEAVGITLAARRAGLPVVVSPTVELDGTLPDGSQLAQFIERVDAATSGAPAFYMVNCAHPSHLWTTLDRAAQADDAWLKRLRGLRANASCKSHAELDASPELDRGDPLQLARQLAALQKTFGLRVLGGCCGTDAEHIATIAAAL